MVRSELITLFFCKILTYNFLESIGVMAKSQVAGSFKDIYYNLVHFDKIRWIFVK